MTRATNAQVPSVLVVLVVKDGAPWLRECLQALAAQTYPRVGVLAVDNASRDGSRDLLERALGPGRVVALDRNAGVAGAVREALARIPAAREADYLLVMHDDTVLAPDAVERLVAAAGLEGVERVGVVGPKVVDWADPRILREVGRSTDRFGHPSTPLQDGEVDHGQYDRVREVLFVSSAAMLVSRAAWERTGPFDERLVSHHEDLDFCWRARVAGFRVLMTPLATARHRGAAGRGERPPARRRGHRYEAERAALAAMLKNYSALTLAWLLPLYVVIGTARLALLLLGRRLEEAWALVAAWGWNLRHLPGTLRRRVRAQAVRSVPDREIRRFMESSIVRLPRWLETAGRILAEQQELDHEEAAGVRVHAASLARDHPVLVAWAVALAVGALAVRRFLGPEVLQGGALPGFPSRPDAFFAELASGVRTTALGGADPASPALAALGALSFLSGASTALAQKVVLAAGVPLAGAMLYRAALRRTEHRAAAVVAGAAYATSAAVLWAFSEGRIGLLVALAMLPLVVERIDAAARTAAPAWRLGVSAGVPLAIGAAFWPGVAPAAGVFLIVGLLASRRRIRVLGTGAVAAAVGGALVFPLLPPLIAGRATGSLIGPVSVADAARLAPGASPGSSWAAWFLPAAAILAFSIAGREERGQAWRMALAALLATGLAWASAARWLPLGLANGPAYLGAAAVAEATLVGLGVRTVMEAVGREAFGYRQVVAVLLAAVLGAGLGAQAVASAAGAWAVRPGALPPAWPVIASSAPGPFRVLWVGEVDGRSFPPPGGDPQAIAEAGSASLRFAVTDRGGVSALDVGRGQDPLALARLEEALAEILSGTTRHGGALLAPFGIRFVVAEDGDLPGPARARLAAQLDLDLIPAGGLVIYRNARSLPPAAVTSEPAWVRAAARAEPATLAGLPPARARPLPAAPGGFRGRAEGGVVLLADRYASGWRLEADGRAVPSSLSFGWATRFPAPDGAFRLVYREQWIRSAQLGGLAVLWLVALWLTRRRAAR